MLRTLLVTALAVALLTASAHAQPTVLMPGVTYERQLSFSRFGPKVVHVVTAPRPGGLYSLRTVLSNGLIPGKETVSAIQRRLAPAAMAVGINGDFANAEGTPAGVLIQGGGLVVDPTGKRASIGVDTAGTLRAERLTLAATWQGRGQRRPLVGVNRRPGPNGVSLYTAAWGGVTPSEPGSVAAVFSVFPALRPGGDYSGTVTQLLQAGSAPVPPGGAVLVGRGTQAQRIAEEAPAGQQVTLRLVPNTDWSGVTEGLAGGPVLVRGGKAVFNAREEFSHLALSARRARAAVGQRADGTILLVAVDGGLPGFSVGMTNFELAQTLVRLGAVTAAALESGPAAALAFDGKLLSRPAGAERPVSEMLAVLYEGVHATPPEPIVLSPNGDAVDEQQTLRYRVVRPSSVAVTLVEPLGTVRTIETVERAPGSYTLPWTGRKPDGTLEPEGAWRWVVSARDDQSRQSSVEQPFWVNTTLAGLRAEPAVVPVTRRGGALHVSFTLAHGATWTATIETPRGTVLRSYTSRTAAPGPASFAWDGLYRKRARAYSGRHVVRVEATNEFGTAELAQSFSVRRVGR